MAVGQGFFVEAYATGNILFKNSQRAFKTKASSSSFFYKTSSIKTKTTSKTEETNSYIRLGYEDPDGFHRQLLLGFMPNTACDLNCNIGYDALMFDARPNELFFEMANDTIHKYVIQGVGAFDNTYELSIGFTMDKIGNHKIMLDATDNFTAPIYIKDVITGETFDLRNAPFEPNLPVGNYLTRFKLVFKTQTALAVNDFNKLGTLNAFYNGYNSIVINNPLQLIVKNVIVYNLLGQQVVQLKINNTTKQISIPFQQIKGIYMVKVESEKGISTIKILN